MKSVTVSFKLNGEPLESTVDARMHLVDFLRDLSRHRFDLLLGHDAA